MPCSGRKRLNIPRGHVYSVKKISTGEYLGFMTKETAENNIGVDNFDISMSDSLCPVCAWDISSGPKLVVV